MSSDALNVRKNPSLEKPAMVIGLSGWMDGGDASTGTVDFLCEATGAEPFAEIEPEDFFIYNFPGSMEVSALFRPACSIDDGSVKSLDFPSSVFYASPDKNLILLQGKEPHLRWRDYGDCVYAVVREHGVGTILFVGSVAGVVPHTRTPRIRASASEEGFLGDLETRYGLGLLNYEGPASLVTYLTVRAPSENVRMANLVAEIPAYVQGKNPRSIDTLARKVSSILDLDIDVSTLDVVCEAFEKRLSEVVAQKEDLAELVERMEKDYDAEIHERGDTEELRQWFENQDIRLD